MLIFTLAGCIAFIMLVGLLVMVLHVRAKQKTRHQQALGIQWLAHLRVFLARIQKHRGLTSGYLKGDQSSASEIERLQRGIAEDISKIEHLGEWMRKNERWKTIAEHWSRLSVRYRESDPANNLNQHHCMIQNTLYLIEDMADEHSLIKLKTDSSKGVEFLWKDLLQTIEYMGQARAIGTGVAASGRCGSVDRIKLNYLHKKIERGTASVIDELPNKSVVQTNVSTLLNYIDEKILAAQCEVTPTDYFSTATKTLECLYEQYDLTLQKLTYA